MGLFRRLFGGPEDKPADDSPQTTEAGSEATEAEDEPGPAKDGAEPIPDPAPTSLGDPYRGSLHVPAAAPTPRRPTPDVVSIWDSWTEVFAIERGEPEELPVRSLVYCGESDSSFQAIRRVSFVDGGVVVDWEHRLTSRDFLENHFPCRIEDRIFVPRASGIIAVHLETGEPCWELPHPAALHKRPVRYPDGDLLFVFADQSWMRLAPRDGSFRAEGRVRSEREADELLQQAARLTAPSDDSIRYGGHLVQFHRDGLHVELDDDESGPDEPPAPTAGVYPIDEWKPESYIGLVGGKLAVCLGREWGGRTRIAVGLFEPTSLEPLRLVELGEAGEHSSQSGAVVDDLLLLSFSVATGAPGSDDSRFSTFLVDIRAERALACFASSGPSYQFDVEGRQIWRGEV